MIHGVLEFVSSSPQRDEYIQNQDFLELILLKGPHEWDDNEILYIQLRTQSHMFWHYT